MGTNYYVGERTPCACCGRPLEQLHIGKSSIGWKFLFAPYPTLGLTSWAAWKAYLADKKILDEYDREVSLEDLETLVRNKQANGLCSQTAPAAVWGPWSRDTETADAEGYRFSSTPDFS